MKKKNRNPNNTVKYTLIKDKLSEDLKINDSMIKESSLRKRISRYKKKGLLVSVKKGIYAVSRKPVYTTIPDDFIRNIHKSFVKKYDEIKFCIWSTAVLNDFIIHQPAKYFYIFETEQDIVESAFNLFRDNGFNAFLNPDEKSLQLYVLEQKDTVVVKPLITRSPLLKVNKIYIPSLEKILVDLFSDKKLFFFLQGNELNYLFNFTFDKFSINYTKLFNYAGRRGVKNKLLEYLKKNVQIPEDIISYVN